MLAGCNKDIVHIRNNIPIIHKIKPNTATKKDNKLSGKDKYAFYTRYKNKKTKKTVLNTAFSTYGAFFKSGFRTKFRQKIDILLNKSTLNIQTRTFLKTLYFCLCILIMI